MKIASKFTLIGAALMLANIVPALADSTSPSENVTIFGPYTYSQSNSFRAFHDEGESSVSVRVSYADLDLTTQVGYYTMQRRVSEAAQNVCHELQKHLASDPGDERECIRTATNNALKQVGTIVAELERATKVASLH